jgi:hypothetical protein
MIRGHVNRGCDRDRGHSEGHSEAVEEAPRAEGTLSTIGDVAIGLLGTVLLWTLVVGAFCAVVMVMAWLTSRIFRLTGRRRE